LTDGWIRYNYALAQDALRNGDPVAALAHYGFAAHSLQDTTSPEHNVEIPTEGGIVHAFRQWRDSTSLPEAMEHVTNEATYPGAGSSLQHSTNGLYEMFFNGSPLPNENELIFNRWGVDRPTRPNVIRALQRYIG
jgi:hypothetical protein